MLRRSDAENGLQKRYEASPNDPVSRFSVSEFPSCPPFLRCIISERALLFLLTVFSVNAGPVFALLFQGKGAAFSASLAHFMPSLLPSLLLPSTWASGLNLFTGQSQARTIARPII